MFMFMYMYMYMCMYVYMCMSTYLCIHASCIYENVSVCMHISKALL